MTIADYLSRVGPNGDLVACVTAGTRQLEPDLSTTVFTIEQLRDEQRMDPQISPVRAALLSEQDLSSFSPFELLFARSARRPETCISDPPAASETEPVTSGHTPAEEVTQRRQLLDQLQRDAQLNLREPRRTDR
ncbi:uncharacterized protein LOC122378216 [Amphibalanus amphitrite]|uniref:uncharacterized protein LOC122378216 n=1 Tax=Amphibalanus amphitrite TaxID=1232801 RepID=UPI001C9127CF|nr:uncharacterized protein LOC122378216 [Amphibalanus amphitrite]